MVLEALIEEKQLLRTPSFMLLEAIIISSIALWTSHYIFPASSSVLSIAFVTIALVPLIHSVFIEEEKIEELKPGSPIGFIGRHFELIKIYGFFFLGLVISYTLWFSFLPLSNVDYCLSERLCVDVPGKDNVFKEQLNTIQGIENLKANVTGLAVGGNEITGQVTLPSGCSKNISCVFELIFFNNANVLLFAVILSFVYGAGALMLLGWNASVIGVVIGQNVLAQNHFSFIGLMPHGIPEIMAYFLAAISGELIGLAMIKKHTMKRMSKLLLIDSLVILIISLVILLIGAVIETLLIFKEEVIAIILSVLFIVLFAALVFKGLKERQVWF